MMTKWRMAQLCLITVWACGYAAVSQGAERYEVGDGELTLQGYFRTEGRFRIEDDSYNTQLINRFQLEAELSFTEKGIFDELAFVSVLRPEYDLAQTEDGLSGGRVGRNARRPVVPRNSVLLRERSDWFRWVRCAVRRNGCGIVEYRRAL